MVLKSIAYLVIYCFPLFAFVGCPAVVRVPIGDLKVSMDINNLIPDLASCDLPEEEQSALAPKPFVIKTSIPSWTLPLEKESCLAIGSAEETQLTSRTEVSTQYRHHIEAKIDFRTETEDIAKLTITPDFRQTEPVQWVEITNDRTCHTQYIQASALSKNIDDNKKSPEDTLKAPLTSSDSRSATSKQTSSDKFGQMTVHMKLNGLRGLSALSVISGTNHIHYTLYGKCLDSQINKGIQSLENEAKTDRRLMSQYKTMISTMNAQNKAKKEAENPPPSDAAKDLLAEMEAKDSCKNREVISQHSIELEVEAVLVCAGTTEDKEDDDV